MKTRSITAAVFAALILLLAALAPASAHTVTPTSASPADGEVLAQSPGQVTLTFSEEAGEEGSMLQVFDAQGKQVDLGNGGVDLNDPNHAGLVVKLPVLGQGVYLVKWKIALSDGDSSQGQYYFGVGSVTLPQNPPAAAAANAAGQQPGGVTGESVAFLATGILILVAAIIFYRYRRKAPSKP